jgi:hypothetical protein
MLACEISCAFLSLSPCSKLESFAHRQQLSTFSRGQHSVLAFVFGFGF